MDEYIDKCVHIGSQKYPKTSKKFIEYGTSGFREKAIELPHVVFRMGILAVIRSRVKNGATIGLMITASHNPEEDNGIKLCDPTGVMLNREWEAIATNLANVEKSMLNDVLQQILATYNVVHDSPAFVYLARDTRSSSESLAQAALDGAKSFNGVITDFGLLTTPQLHYVVCCKNDSSYGDPTVESYYRKLSTAFDKIRTSEGKVRINYKPHIHVDCANGVGAPKLKEMLGYLTSLKVDIFNNGQNGILNYKCGADFVKVMQVPPEGVTISTGERYASLDGDADRLIYFYKDENGTFHLLDGDKIASLVAKYLKNLITMAELNFEMRVIQTAYANGSSTYYIENDLKIPVVCVPTGVKHLHNEAQKYDIGIYFEANGHGTVLFSSEAKKQLHTLANNKEASNRQRKASEKVLNTIDVINETVGDALSDLLLVETILYEEDWSISDWDSLYKDLSSRQLKVAVPDKRAICTTNANRTCTKPEGLQEAIDSVVSKYPRARAFVRPSGTEDIVRIYAEGSTQENADTIAEEIKLSVKKVT